VSPLWKKKVVLDFIQNKTECERARTEKEKGQNIIAEDAEGNQVVSLNKQKAFKAVFLEADPNKRHPPKMSTMVNIDIVLADKMLDWICDILMDMQETGDLINSYQCMWIYSILLVFDKPLLSDYCGMMNEILTFAIKSHEELKNPDVKKIKDPKDEIVASLTIISLVIMEYFEQRLYNL